VSDERTDFSDNYFDLAGGESRTVKLRSEFAFVTGTELFVDGGAAQVFEGLPHQAPSARRSSQNLKVARGSSRATHRLTPRAKSGPSPLILSLTGRGEDQNRDSSLSAALRASAGGSGVMLARCE
jgi:hypothetical protein